MAQTATVLKFESRPLHAFQRHESKLPWFVLAEVCKILEITDIEVASRRLDEDEKSWSVQYTDQGRRMLIVSLSGLTRLAATSRKPIAKRFNKWIHSDVVVSIFLTGEFSGDSTPLDELVGTFQPLLDLPLPAQRGKANVVPLKPEVRRNADAQTAPAVIRLVDNLVELPDGSLAHDAPIYARIALREDGGTDDPRVPALPRGEKALALETWSDGSCRMRLRRDLAGRPFIFWLYTPNGITKRPIEVPNANGTSRVLVYFGSDITPEILERNFRKLGEGSHTPAAIGLLLHHLAMGE
jgi:hypothetical protein